MKFVVNHRIHHFTIVWRVVAQIAPWSDLLLGVCDNLSPVITSGVMIPPHDTTTTPAPCISLLCLVRLEFSTRSFFFFLLCFQAPKQTQSGKWINACKNVLLVVVYEFLLDIHPYAFLCNFCISPSLLSAWEFCHRIIWPYPYLQVSVKVCKTSFQPQSAWTVFYAKIVWLQIGCHNLTALWMCFTSWCNRQ